MCTGPPLHVRTGRWAKRAVSALVDVAPLGQGGGDLPQTRRHTAPRTPKRKSHTDVTGDSCVTDCTTPCADTYTLAHATARLDSARLSHAQHGTCTHERDKSPDREVRSCLLSNVLHLPDLLPGVQPVQARGRQWEAVTFRRRDATQRPAR